MITMITIDNITSWEGLEAALCLLLNSVCPSAGGQTDGRQRLLQLPANLATRTLPERAFPLLQVAALRPSQLLYRAQYVPDSSAGGRGESRCELKGEERGEGQETIFSRE